MIMKASMFCVLGMILPTAPSSSASGHETRHSLERRDPLQLPGTAKIPSVEQVCADIEVCIATNFNNDLCSMFDFFDKNNDAKLDNVELVHLLKTVSHQVNGSGDSDWGDWAHRLAGDAFGREEKYYVHRSRCGNCDEEGTFVF
jgi:hypothetical protein